MEAGAEFDGQGEGFVAFVELDGFADVIDHDAAGVALGEVLAELLTDAGLDGAVDVFVEGFEQVVAVHNGVASSQRSEIGGSCVIMCDPGDQKKLQS